MTMHKMNLAIRTFRRLMHVERMKTQINTLRGVAATVRFNPSLSSSAELVDAASPKVQSPCLMLPPLMDETTGGMVYSFFNPIDKNILRIKKDKISPLPNDARCYWSYHGWLAFIDPQDCGLYLWDPFHSYSNSCHPSNDVVRLPPIETLPCVVGCDRRGGGIEYFVMRYWAHCDDHCIRKTPANLSEYFVHSLTFSSAPSPLSTENNDCTVMAIFKVHRGGCLAFCKLGDTSWTALDGPLGNYTQITYSTKDQVFYAMGAAGEIEAWDLRDHSSIKRIPIDDDYRNYSTPRFKEPEADLRKKLRKEDYLLESSSGDLLLVIKHRSFIFSNKKPGYNRRPYKTLRFDVYKLDSSMGKWKYVKCLGDNALFLGLTDPFLLCVRNFPGLRPNCIYFADDDTEHCCYVKEGYNYGGHDLGIFNLEDHKVEAYYPFGDLKRIEPPPIWVTPNLNGSYAV